MIIASKSQNKKNISLNNQSAIKFYFDKITLESDLDNSIFSLPFEINVSSIIKGAKNIYSILIYDKSEYSLGLKPKKIIVFDASKSINNDLLKYSTIISNSRFNSFNFDVIEKNSQEENSLNAIDNKNYFNYENYSNNKLEENFDINKNNFDIFLKTGEIFFSKIESKFNFNLVDKNITTENSNKYGDSLKIKSFNSTTSDFDKNYYYRKNINNLKFKKSSVFLEIDKKYLENDLICYILLGDYREKSINQIANNAIGYFELSNKNIDPNINSIKEFEANVISKSNDIISIEIKNNSKFKEEFNLTLLTREKKDSFFSLHKFSNFVLEPNKSETTNIKNKQFLKFVDLFLIIESNCLEIKNKTKIIKLKTNNSIKEEFLNNEIKFQNYKIFSFINNDLNAINVEAIINAGNTKDFTILKRELSINGLTTNLYSKIEESNIERTKNSIIAIDKAIKHDKIYEYCIFSLKDLKQLNCKTLQFYRNPVLFPDKLANLSIDYLNENSEFDEFLINVDFSFTRFEQVLSSLLNSTNGNIETSNANIQIGNYIENIKNNREKLSNIFQVNVIIQDLSNGFEYDLGNFPAGNLKIDSKLRNTKNIPNVKNARYIFRLLQRNAITLFDDIEQSKLDKETLTEFKFKISKFLSPLNLISNFIPGDSKKSKLFVDDEFLLGWTGISKTLIKNNKKTFNNNVVSITVKKINDKNLINLSGDISNESIGIIIFCNFKNIKVPICFLSKENWKGDYVDPIYLLGPRKYEVCEILSNLSFGKNFFSNVIL